MLLAVVRFLHLSLKAKNVHHCDSVHAHCMQSFQHIILVPLYVSIADSRHTFIKYAAPAFIPFPCALAVFWDGWLVPAFALVYSERKRYIVSRLSSSRPSPNIFSPFEIVQIHGRILRYICFIPHERFE